MPYDEGLAQRVRTALTDEAGVDEKKMFGGLAFMLHGHMCCGVIKDTLMVRVGPEQYAAALARRHAHELDFTGRPMTGMVVVEPAGLASNAELGDWVGHGVRYASSLPPR
jgi:hypothetical protein